MSFQNYNGILRRIGRKAVLPEKEIKETISREVFTEEEQLTVFDFGAGTLGWSQWFQECGQKVYAIDVIYENGMIGDLNVLHSIDDVSDDMLVKTAGGGVLWACDVCHHISHEFTMNLINRFAGQCKFIIIKDIDVRYRFGNFMNKFHDKVINGESIRNIDPILYENELKERGYDTRYFFYRKIWYPHFLIIAKKND